MPEKSTEPQTTDVQALLNARGFSGYQWIIFALCFLVVLFDGFDTAAMGYIAPSLISDWGLSRTDLAPVLGAALLGLAVGAFGAGPLADHWGRKSVLVVSVALFALASLASAFSPDVQTLTVLRFVTGIGLGAAMPNAVTLMSEYCPDARRATLTNAMFCGFPLGAAMGGFVAAWMIPAWGWASVLLLGGIAPLLLLVLLLRLLPESLRYLVAQGYPAEQLRKVVARVIGRSVAPAQAFVLGESRAEGQEGSAIALVVSPRYRLGSAMLWLAYFMGLVIFYALVNWMPVIFSDAGLDARTGALVAALFPLGGVGAVLSGWLMDRFNADRVVALGYGLAAVAVACIGLAVGQLAWLVAAVLLAGLFMNTAQASMPALAAGFYPTRGRATGVAWMLAIGRFGGITGSLVLAELLVRRWGTTEIFAVLAIPGLIGMVALLVKQHFAALPQVPRAHAGR
ncbi:AAHS family 4-hydroxybenzoate transporter-like MFS transporter [Comamonas sp. BIGb0152]|nr:MFS transporter [Comamonas sp. BIGb0152]MCS4295945.1 AAHS family 4-hydroxybenzoate transporter-like MFS transporter [Comamonas sp. BIGb0152]